MVKNIFVLKGKNIPFNVGKQNILLYTNLFSTKQYLDDKSNLFN